MASFALEHVRRVKMLYKLILRLHRSLPVEVRLLGDSYTKEEFKRHKKANVVETAIFMEEWTKYAAMLARQLHPKYKEKLGISLNEEILDKFSETQVGQLYELYQEATKPIVPKDGDNKQPEKDNKPTR